MESSLHLGLIHQVIHSIFSSLLFSHINSSHYNIFLLFTKAGERGGGGGGGHEI